jgi:AcrR family transcriptional regulator
VPRAKERTPQLRDQVLEAALRVLAEGGVAAVTTRTVAREAGTSTPAVYELFGDKGGLVREVFFEGFRRLRRHLAGVAESADPRADLIALAWAYRGFMRDNPILAEVMLSRPFTDFSPGPNEVKASGSVRNLIIERVRRCVAAGVFRGDPTDIAHVLVSVVQGLASAENARRLGTSRRSVERRWALALDAIVTGLSS